MCGRRMFWGVDTEPGARMGEVWGADIDPGTRVGRGKFGVQTHSSGPRLVKGEVWGADTARDPV